MSVLPRSINKMGLLGDFYVHFPGASITTGYFVMTQGFGDTAGSSSQSTVMRMQPCRIRKILVSTNGASEFSSGSMEWELWKNAVRTGTPTFTSNAMLPIVSPTNFEYNVDGQLSRWFDTDINMTESDYLTARLAAVSVVGGPEGIYMQLWGYTTATE